MEKITIKLALIWDAGMLGKRLVVCQEARAETILPDADLPS